MVIMNGFGIWSFCAEMLFNGFMKIYGGFSLCCLIKKKYEVLCLEGLVLLKCGD